jgi:hypothetical protein
MAAPSRPADYALDVARLLWPASPGLSVSRQRSTPGHRDAYVFPSARRPRVLMPVDVPGSTTMLRRLGKGRSRFSRTTREALARSVESPMFGYLRWPILRLPLPAGTDDSIEHYLATHLGSEVRVGVLLGTPRANQKPVLQLFTPSGRLLGFAKVGHNPLTSALVRREGDNLELVGRHRAHAFRPPRLLHRGQWRGLEILAMSALTTAGRLPVPEHTLAAAMREVATLGGTTRSALSASAFWRRLRAESARVGDPALRDRLQATLSRVDRRWGDAPLELGGWHGDWGFWNMALVDDVVHLWDWERYDARVPIGFDALHHAAQRVRPLDRDVSRQERRFVQAAPATLGRMGVGADLAGPTLGLYLLEVAVRYALALDEVPAPALRCRAAWALALLDHTEGTRR